MKCAPNRKNGMLKRALRFTIILSFVTSETGMELIYCTCGTFLFEIMYQILQESVCDQMMSLQGTCWKTKQRNCYSNYNGWSNENNRSHAWIQAKMSQTWHLALHVSQSKLKLEVVIYTIFCSNVSTSFITSQNNNSKRTLWRIVQQPFNVLVKGMGKCYKMRTLGFVEHK